MFLSSSFMPHNAVKTIARKIRFKYSLINIVTVLSEKEIVVIVEDFNDHAQIIAEGFGDQCRGYG